MKVAVTVATAQCQPSTGGQLSHARYVLRCGTECAELGNHLRDIIIDTDHVVGMSRLNS